MLFRIKRRGGEMQDVPAAVSSEGVITLRKEEVPADAESVSFHDDFFTAGQNLVNNIHQGKDFVFCDGIDMLKSLNHLHKRKPSPLTQIHLFFQRVFLSFFRCQVKILVKIFY